MDITFQEADTELQNAIDYGNEILGVLTNLEFMNKHIKKFGITKEFIDLVDKDGSFSNTIGMKLEADEETEEEKEKKKGQGPESNNIMSYYEKVSGAIKKFWEYIKTKFKDFIASWFTSIGWLERRLKKVYASKFGSNGKYINEPEYTKVELKALRFEDFRKLWDNCVIGIERVMKIIIDKKTGIDFDSLRITDSLKIIGYEITENKETGIFEIEKKDPIEAVEGTVGSLGYTVKRVAIGLNVMDKRIDSIKKLSTVIDRLEKYKKDFIKGEIKVTKKVFMSQVNTVISCCRLFAKVFEKLLWMLTKIALKAPLNK